MRKRLSLVLTAILLLSVCPIFGSAKGAISVSGLITSDRVWSQGNTYTLTGPVGVTNGATLTIEPGVTVNLASYYIQINGTLKAQGTGSNKIVFTTFGYNYQSPSNYQNLIQFMETSSRWDDQTSSGCIIQYALFNSVGTTVTGASPKFTQNNYNSSGMTIYSGSPTIVNNVFNRSGVSTYGSGVISNNFFKGGGAAITASSTIRISDNVIDDYSTGVVFWGDVVFTENTVTNCDVGIQCEASTVSLSNNYICNNGYGIKGGGNIESNTIMNNTIGLDLTQSGYLTTIPVKNNNIYNNTHYNLQMERSGDVDATNNYWGTTNNDNIGASIYDSADDFSKGKVTYQPSLSSQSSSAPTAPSTGLLAGWSLSFESGQPQVVILNVAELVVITLVIVWTAIVAVLVVRKRKKKKP